MIQKRMSYNVLIHPRTEVEKDIRNYYILYYLIVVGITSTLFRIELIIMNGKNLSDMGIFTVFILSYCGIRYLASLLYVLYNVNGVLKLLTFWKMRSLISRWYAEKENKNK